MTMAGDKEHEDFGEAGGDPVCWARLVCEECGAVLSEGHNDGCSSGDSSRAGSSRPADEPAH